MSSRHQSHTALSNLPLTGRALASPDRARNKSQLAMAGNTISTLRSPTMQAKNYAS